MNTNTEPIYYREYIHEHGNDAYRVAKSAILVDEFKELVEIDETEKAELDFSDALNSIEDKELRERLDAAAGKLTEAYEKYGIIIGYLCKTCLRLPKSDFDEQRVKLPRPIEPR